MNLFGGICKNTLVAVGIPVVASTSALALSAVATAIAGWELVVASGPVAGHLLKQNVERGARGEYNVGLEGPKKAIDVLRLSGEIARRYPDLIDRVEKLMLEVKNVQYQSYTAQLRDYVTFAQAEKIHFILIIDELTELSGPLLQAIEQGLIDIAIMALNGGG